MLSVSFSVWQCGKQSGKLPLGVHLGQEKVLNGLPATIEEFPFVIKLGGCTGSIINNEWALFAAHCGNVGEIIVGSDAPCASGGTRYAVQQNYAYPLYQSIPGGIHQTDANLVKLKIPIAYSSKVAPIQFLQNDNLKIGDKVYVIGWAKGNGEPSLAGKPGGETGGCGRFEYLGGTLSGFFGEAKSSFNNNAPLANSGTRPGDSGGPHFVMRPDGSMAQVGINSTVDSYRNSQAARVSYFYDWIKETTGLSEAKVEQKQNSIFVQADKTSLAGFLSAKAFLLDNSVAEISEVLIQQQNSMVKAIFSEHHLKYLVDAKAQAIPFNIKFKFYYGGSYFNSVVSSEKITLNAQQFLESFTAEQIFNQLAQFSVQIRHTGTSVGIVPIFPEEEWVATTQTTCQVKFQHVNIMPSIVRY
jgi:hypothetical protein